MQPKNHPICDLATSAADKPVNHQTKTVHRFDSFASLLLLHLCFPKTKYTQQLALQKLCDWGNQSPVQSSAGPSLHAIHYIHVITGQSHACSTDDVCCILTDSACLSSTLKDQRSRYLHYPNEMQTECRRAEAHAADGLNNLPQHP